MNAPTDSDDQVRQVFRKYVPEVASDTVELICIAREVSDQVLVAVRSRDPSIHPVSVCSLHLRSIVRELGEKVRTVLWSESPESFVLHALAPYGSGAVRTPKVTLDVVAQIARVEVGPETLAYFSEQDGDGSRVSLASRLVGWDIRFVSHDQV